MHSINYLLQENNYLKDIALFVVQFQPGKVGCQREDF